MKDVFFTRKAEGRRVWPIVFVLLLAAALAVLFLQIGFGVPVILQLLLVLCLCAAVYLFVRYISVSYLYGIVTEGEEVYFTVTQKQGKKSLLQCKLSLLGFCKAERADSAHPFSPDAYTKVYRFSPLFLPEYYDVLYFNDGGETVAVKIHADETFLSALCERAAALREKANEARDNEEEE